MRDKVIVFGAGATGRGHVGLLAWQSGCELVFVEKRPELVERLRRAGRYTVRLYGGVREDISVTNFRVLHHADRESVAKECIDAALVLTTVFDQNLPDVAETLALAVRACREGRRKLPLNCIACENMMDSSSSLGRHTARRINPDDGEYFESFFGFPDCMISRIVPRPTDDELTIIAEDYNEWTVRQEAFRGKPPVALRAMELVDNQSARLERKLFVHNGGHAVCGYVGFHRGHETVHEAVADPVVARHVLGALDELGEVVRTRHAFTAESIQQYKEDFCRRGAIAEMKDQILRVVRDPVRKLSPRERLVAPAMAAVEYGLPRAWIVQGIVAALKYSQPGDDQSQELQKRIHRCGLRHVVHEVCGIDPDNALTEEIERAWTDWKL